MRIQVEQAGVRWGAAAYGIAIAMLAALPFFWMGENPAGPCCGGAMPSGHDTWMHFNQMQAFARGLSAGRWYPRWDEETHGYGAPTTSFYPPAAYYLTSLFYFLTGRNWQGAWIGFYCAAALGAAWGMYVYASRRLSRGATALVVALYVLGPYRLINQYQRGAMAELLAFAFIPLALHFAERLAEDDDGRRRNFLGLSAAYGAFLASHPPTAYQFTLVLGVCLAVRVIALRRAAGAALAVGALGVGSMLAAAYFYPAIAEQGLVYYDDVERTWPYHASYVYDVHQTYNDHVNNPFFVRIDRIWALQAIAIVLAAILLATARASASRARRDQWTWIGAGLLAAFLMTPWSAPVGRWIPGIKIGVFSWRMLALTGFSMALLAGACLDRLGRRWLRAFAGSLFLVAAVAMSGWYVVWPVWRVAAFTPNPDHYNYATLPRGAPREVPVMNRVQTASGTGRIATERWEPELRLLRVELPRADRLLFRTFLFPGWEAWVDDRPVALQAGIARNIMLEVPAGAHRVRLEYGSTPVRQAADWVSLASFLAWLGMWGSEMRRRHRSRLATPL